LGIVDEVNNGVVSEAILGPKGCIIDVDVVDGAVSLSYEILEDGVKADEDISWV
jgi:hypothetical protein